MLKKYLPFVCIYVSVLLLFSQENVFSQPVQPVKVDTQSLDSLFNIYEKNSLYFASVELETDGKSVYHRQAGFQNLESRQKIDGHTVFLIGSITKTYTAVIIMQLIEEGRLKLSDKLSMFYPQIPNSDAITIEMLLRHRSGLFNYTSADDFLKVVSSPISKNDLLARFVKYGIRSAPDEKYEYCNTNYMLLGFIIEDITRKDYGDQLRKRILNKLSLKSTYYGRPKDTTHLGHSYTRMNNEWKPVTPEWDVSWVGGAGAIAATLKDVQAFFKGLFGGKLVADTSLRKMMQLKDEYGLGLAYIPYGEKRFYGHSGRIEAFNTLCAYRPEDHLMIAMASNGAFSDPNDISIQLLNASYGNKIQYPDLNRKEAVNVSAEILKNYEGEYSAEGFPLVLRVFAENSRLFCQATGQAAFPLTAQSDNLFTFDPAGIRMEFYTTEGRQGIHFKQANLSLDFHRK